MSISQIQKVRILYKTILKLHCGLPVELQALGDNYVKDEFKRHRKCNIKEADIFMNEWTNYALNLAKQLGIQKPKLVNNLGEALNDYQLENFRHEQLVQLYELMLAAQGCVDDNQQQSTDRESIDRSKLK